MGSGDKAQAFGRSSDGLKKSRVILDARIKRITEVCGTLRPLSVRDISQSMFAMANAAQAIPKPWPCALSLKLRGSEGRLQGEIGDILNSLQGKRSKNKHIQALLGCCSDS
jgi:hypothetical protein